MNKTQIGSYPNCHFGKEYPSQCVIKSYAMIDIMKFIAVERGISIG